MIYSQVVDVNPGSLMEVHPSKPIYVPMLKTFLVDQIRMNITDQNNNPVRLHHEKVTYFLNIRVKNS